MAKNTSTDSAKPITMEELLASQKHKLTILHRGQEVEGEVAAISDQEIILDLGAKSEGVMLAREFSADLKSALKIGSRLKAYVVAVENEHGQVYLSLSPISYGEARLNKRHFEGKGARGKTRGGRFFDWSRFVSVLNQKTKLQGTVLEINKGGLIVEVGGVRGFLPNSQVGFELLSKAGKGLEDLAGESLTVTVIEVDADNNKLIFSQRGSISEETKAKLLSFKKDQVVSGKVVAVLPFGLVVDVSGTEGLVFISDVSWERVEDLSKICTAGEEVKVKILDLDLELGRLNLSVKKLSEDPFAKIAEQFPADEVVKGEITAVTETGVSVSLKNPAGETAEGFLSSSKIKTGKYETGQTATFLVDSVDVHKRRINLAPFVTSTEGLIYK